MPDQPISGRCYCGAIEFRAATPKTVAYCHCEDCRRITGAPVAAFAAFDRAEVDFPAGRGQGFSINPCVQRWSCPKCTSPLAAEFDYLPDQTYVPLGLIDQAADLPPEIHCHKGSKHPGLHISDDLPTADGSGRATLNQA